MEGEKPVVEEELMNEVLQRSDNVPSQNEICQGGKGTGEIIVRKEMPNAKAVSHAKRHARL